MAVPGKNGKIPESAGIGREREKGKSQAVYIEIEELPREEKWGRGVKEEAGWLFMEK